MRIAFVIPGGVDRGGREHVVPMFLWLIERLARRHDLHVFVLDYYDEPCTYDLLGATVHDLGRPRSIRGTRRFRVAQRLDDALRRQGPFDLLHAYWGMPAGVAAAQVATAMRLPFILTLDSGELVRIDDIAYGLQRRWIDRRAVRAAIRGASVVTVPTTYMSKLMPPGSTAPTIIPMGVDRSVFTSVNRVDGPPWRLIRVGSINPVKDYPTLLHAFAAVVQREPDVHLDVVGEDTLGGAISRLATRLGLDARVSFHGPLESARVAPLYAQAHVNLVSSRHESANVTVLEAACTGVPTVGTAVGYIADLHPDAAIAVPVRSPLALADAIVSLLRDPERRRRIGLHAREWALTHDADWTADTFDALYQRVRDRTNA
jgi:glycosyltransferase involved in cell wall biosynthesis